MKEKLWSKDFAITIFLNFTAYLTHLMILSTFPFFVSYLGYSTSIAGLCAALFSVVAVISRPLVGWMLDNGHRRLIMLVGLLVLLVLPMGYLLIYTVLASIVLTIVMRLIHGFAYATANTAAATIAADIIPKSRFAEGMGMFGLSTAFGTACAPFLGEFLMDIGFPFLFIVTSCIVLVALILLLTMRHISIPMEKKKLKIRELINVDALPASAVALVFVLTYGAQESYILKFATESDAITVSGGFYFLVMAALLLVSRLIIGRISERTGEAPFVYVCCPLMTVALLMLSLVHMHGNLVFLIAGGLSGISFGCMEPSLQAMAVSTATPDRRGAASSTFLCSFDIGIGVGAAIAGVLIDVVGFRYMYMIMSLTSLAALVVYLLVARNHPTSLTWAIKHRGEEA